MGKPYSKDLRERVRAEVESGQSRRGAARRYDVSASFAVKLADRVLRTGSSEPARQGRPPGGGKLAPHLTALLEWVEAKADLWRAIGDICALYSEQECWNYLKDAGYAPD